MGGPYRIPSEYDPLLTDRLWDRSGLLSGFCGAFDGINISYAEYYEWPDYETGARSCNIISGITRDANGDPLGGCAVHAFTTSDDIEQGEAVSDINGGYALDTPRTDAHYLVAYKAGAPDVAGTSVNTIIPV
jgi:hypothetical protein